MNALILTILASTSAADRVVVFPDRAQVTRLTTVTCGARVPVTFEHLPPAAAQDRRASAAAARAVPSAARVGRGRARVRGRQDHRPV